MDVAKEQAMKKRQTILLHLSSSEAKETHGDFCAILDSADFMKVAAKTHTLMRYKFSDADISAEKQQDIRNTYSFEEDNTLYILSAEGYVLSVILYQEDFTTVQAVLNALIDAERNIPPLQLLVNSVNESDGVQKVRAIDALYEATNEHYRAPLAPLYATVPNLDPTNETALVGKYELLYATKNAEEALFSKGADVAAAFFTELCTTGHLNTAERFKAYYYAAYLYSLAGSSDFNAMLNLLNSAYDSLLMASADELSQIPLQTQDVQELIQQCTALRAYYGEGL